MSFLNSGQSGYFNAPLSKLILLLTLGLNTLAAIIGSRRGGTYLLGYKSDNLRQLLFNPLQWWRFLTGPFILSSAGELFFTVILLYVFRLFERLWGTQKFSVFTVVTFVLSFLIQVTVNSSIALFRGASHPLIWSGPYALIFGCLAQYMFEIPAMSKFEVARFKITEKHVTLLLSIQLLFSNFPYSLIAGLAGVLGGLLYRFEPMRLSYIRVPSFLARLATKYMYPLLSSSPPRSRRPRRASATATPSFQQIQQEMLANQEQHQAHGREPSTQGYTDNLLGPQDNNDNWNVALNDFYAAAAAHNQQQQQQQQQPAQVSDEHIATLMEMGYDRQEARNALLAAGNNLERAADILLAQE